jgi:hypothetical protein
VVFAGFASASMANLVPTAILTCFAIAAAFLADVLLAPALTVLVSPRVTVAASRDKRTPVRDERSLQRRSF